ncbi:MAG: SurA N-terminal domain-containing protein [Deltaproteobacteria bacterium]
MLGALRRNKNNPIITILLGAVAVLMIGFGVSIQGGPAGGHIATVDGEGILESDYNTRYASMFRSRQQRDRKYDRTRAQQDQLRESTLYGMITGKILALEAASQGLAVDDQALRDDILENEMFQVDGKFDKEQYERMLNYMQTSDRNFEQSERDRILAQIYLTALQGVPVSDEELRLEWEQNERKVNIELIRVKKDEFASEVGTVTPEDAKAFLAKEGSDVKVKAYYSKNKASKYDVPKKVCAQQILVRADKHTPPDLLEEARQKAKKAHDAVTGGQDFTAAAKQFSDGNNANKGGEMGCFAVGQVLPKVEEAAFGMKVGDISPILQTNFGFTIIKVNEIKEPVQKKLEEVEDEIATQLVKLDRAGEKAKAEAERVLKKAAEHETLTALALVLNEAKDKPITYNAEETGPFPAGRDFLPRLGSASEIASAAWSLTKEKPLPSKVYETDDAWIVIRLKDKVEPDVSQFEMQKKGLLYSQMIDKQNAVFEGLSKRLRGQHKVEIDPFAFVYDETIRAERRQRRGQF